jgi:hypothetical protein
MEAVPFHIVHELVPLLHPLRVPLAESRKVSILVHSINS